MRESARGGFWALSAEKSTFLRLFWRKWKNPLPRDLNPRPPLLLHRGLSARPDPQLCTRKEFQDRGGPESFQISDASCVLSSLNTLYQGIALSPATLRGASDCGSGLIFPENSHFLPKSCTNWGSNRPPWAKWGRTHRSAIMCCSIDQTTPDFRVGGRLFCGEVKSVENRRGPESFLQLRTILPCIPP